MITEPLRTHRSELIGSSHRKRGGPGALPIVLESPGPRFT